MLSEMESEELRSLFFLQIRNLWRVDGLYFLGVERRFGTEAAAEIDAEVWAVMAKIEAKSLQKIFPTDETVDLPVIMSLLRKSSWALDQPYKTVILSKEKAILTIDRCRTQRFHYRIIVVLPEKN